MGSRNTSGSVQSSSGGDKFDSDHSSAHFGRTSAVSIHTHLPSAALFDSSAHYLSQSPFSASDCVVNMDLLRPSSAGGFAGASPSVFGRHHQQGGFVVDDNNNPSSLIMHSRSFSHENGASSEFPTYPCSDNIACPNRTSSENIGCLKQTTASLGVRNPKKRTRASRRAPTTVLTTDTSNFRAMVQEFTGVPALPFSGRLDLFGSSRFGSGRFDPTRPAVQKIRPFNAENSGNFNIQSPGLSFQPLHQRPPRHHQVLSSSSIQERNDEGKVLDYTGAPSGFDHRNGPCPVPGGLDGPSPLLEN